MLLMEVPVMLHRLGVISDTHIPAFKGLPEAVWTIFADVECIIHAGDLSRLSVLDELTSLAPVVAVQGNIEEREVIHALPIKREILVGGLRIGIVHILGDAQNRAKAARQEFPTARCVIFGHSHIPYNQEHTGQLLFNPGSANDRRNQPTCSLGILTIDDETQHIAGSIIPI
jgi:putative phosphoesterase